MKKKDCGPVETLAHFPGYRVDRCSCGLFHVCIGPVTVHLEPDAFLTFANVVAHATEAVLNAERTPQPSLSLVGGFGAEVAES